MVKQKNRYKKIDACGPRFGLYKLVWYYCMFAYEDLASCIKISQITHFFCIFSWKKTLAHGESKTWIFPIDACDSRLEFHTVVW
jgi:hypothetical protein